MTGDLLRFLKRIRYSRSRNFTRQISSLWNWRKYTKLVQKLPNWPQTVYFCQWRQLYGCFHKIWSAPRLCFRDFIIFAICYDIQDSFEHTTSKLFADDFNIFLFHKDIKSLYSLANTELDSLNEWLLANKRSLSIGQDKYTKYTLFAPKRYPDIHNLREVSISGQTVPYTTLNILGCIS